MLRENAAISLADVYAQTRERSLGAEPKRRIMLGTYALSAGYADRYYKKAQAVRELIRRDFDRVFESVDALVTPITPTLPFALGNQDPSGHVFNRHLHGRCEPCGRSGLSLPVGVRQSAGWHAAHDTIIHRTSVVRPG